MPRQKLFAIANLSTCLPCTKYVVSAGLLWYITNYMGVVSKWATTTTKKVSTSMEKLKFKIWNHG